MVANPPGITMNQVHFFRLFGRFAVFVQGYILYFIRAILDARRKREKGLINTKVENNRFREESKSNAGRGGGPGVASVISLRHVGNVISPGSININRAIVSLEWRRSVILSITVILPGLRSFLIEIK